MARLSREHLQPLIGRLQRPAAPVTRGELAWLRRARRVLPEFAAEFRATVHQLRSQARLGPLLGLLPIFNCGKVQKVPPALPGFANRMV